MHDRRGVIENRGGKSNTEMRQNSYGRDRNNAHVLVSDQQIDQGGGKRENDQILYEPEGQIPPSQENTRQNVHGGQLKGLSANEKS
jgi:hypothetical protein